MRVSDLVGVTIMSGAQKMANRMATGVMIAGFVVTAGLFSRGRTGATVFGYPVLTIVFLGLALLASIWLVADIDLPQRRRRSST